MPKVAIYQQRSEARSQGVMQVDTNIVNRAVQGFSGAIDDVAAKLDKRQDEDDALEASRVIAESRNKWLEYSIEKREQVEAGAPGYAQGVMKEYDSFLGETLKSQANPRIKKILDAKLGIDFRSALYEDSLRFEATERLAKRKLDVASVIDNNQRAVAFAPNQYGYLMRETEAAIGASGLKGIERDAALFEAREKLNETWIGSLPPQEQVKLLSGVQAGAGFDAHIDGLIKREGGFVASDGASGAPANFGINQAANPDIDVANLDEAGAKQLYKERYWNQYNLDAVPVETQGIVFDGVVNHRSDFAQALVQAAKEGASPQSLIAMREAEYNRLATTAPEKHGKSLSGWMNRLKDVASGSASAEGVPDWAKYLPPSKAIDMRNKAELAIASDEMRFADPMRRAEIALQYPDNAAISALYKQVADEVNKNPAGYVAQSPAVMRAMADMQADPSELSQLRYLDTLKSEQVRMGVPEHKTRYVTREMADELNTVMKSENATPQQVLEHIDSMRGQYAPVWDRVTGDLRDFGVSGPVAMLASMNNGAYRSEMAEAVLLGDRLKDAIPSDIKPADISAEVDESIEQYREAVSILPQGTRAVADVRESMDLLTKRYLSKGMSLSDAVEEAGKGILDVEIDGTLVLPKGTDKAAVSMMADKVKNRLFETEILPPNGILGDPVKESLYRQRSIEEAKPIVAGDRVIFIGPDGMPLIDASKARRDERGFLMNAESAAISFPISEALEVVQSPQIMAAPDSAGNLLSAIYQQAGVDVSKYFSPKASVDGLQYWGRFPRIDDQPVTKETYSAMTADQKGRAYEALVKNVEYVQKVRSKLPDASRAMFDQYIRKSNESWARREDRAGVLADYAAQVRGQAITPEQARKLRDLRAEANAELFGSGLQYLDMPEWAQ